MKKILKWGLIGFIVLIVIGVIAGGGKSGSKTSTSSNTEQVQQKPEMVTAQQIADAGAVIIDPIDNLIVEKHIIEKSLAKEVIQTCLQGNVYVEFYTVDNYFIQKDQVSDITKKHTHILQREPKTVENISEESKQYEITKIMPIALNDEDKDRVSAILDKFSQQLSISWGVHPVALPLQFAIVTAKGSSKKEGAEAIAKSLNLSLNEILGIGDSTSDWKFISLCGYGATVANGSKELKDLLKSKGEGNYFIADKSVDENGILDILQFFFSTTPN